MTKRSKKLANLATKLLFWRIVLCLSVLALLLTLVTLAFEQALLNYSSVLMLLVLEFLSVCFSGTMQGILSEKLKLMTSKNRPI